MVISDAFPILNYVTQFSHIWSDMIFTGIQTPPWHLSAGVTLAQSSFTPFEVVWLK